MRKTMGPRWSKPRATCFHERAQALDDLQPQRQRAIEARS
jgi:hypothetical protein